MSNMIPKEKQVMNALETKNITQYISKQLSPEKVAMFKQNLIDLIKQNSGNSMWMQISNEELIMTCLQATTRGLSIAKGSGEADIIPYYDKNTQKTRPQLQIGYKGYLKIAMSSNAYKEINSVVVKETDFKGKDAEGKYIFDFSCNSFEECEKKDKEKVIGYYGYILTNNGFKQEMFMSKEKMEKHRDKYSKTGWKMFDFDTMGKKTILRNLLSKYGSAELKEIRNFDWATINSAGEKRYLDNPKTTSNENDYQSEEDYLDSFTEKKDMRLKENKVKKEGE